MNIKQNYKKILGISLILNVIILSLSAVFVLSQPVNTFTITSGVYPQASFTIYKEGITYFAKNVYGLVVYQSLNASYVIQQAIENSEGIVHLIEAIYSIDSNITVNDRTILEGDGIDSTVIQRTANGVTIVLKSGESWTEGILLRDMTIHGNDKTGTLISVETGRSVDIQYVKVTQSNNTGIHIQSGAWGVSLNNVYVSYNEIGVLVEANGVTIYDSVLRFNDATNLRVTSNGYNCRVINNVIEKAQDTNGWNMLIVGGVYEYMAGHLIEGNSFEDAPTGGGDLRISSHITTKITGIRIVNNWFSDDNILIEVRETNKTLISGNYFRGDATAIVLYSSSNKTLVMGNIFNSTITVTGAGEWTEEHNIGYP